MVEGNAGLGEVIEQIVQQNLYRQHRQKWQKDTGAKHAEHVAKGRTSAHLDVFSHIAKGSPSLQYPSTQHLQIFCQQNNIGGFLGNVHRRIHRQAQIRFPQGGGVIDAITHKSHHMAALAQQGNDAGLLQGRQLGKNRCCLHLLQQGAFIGRLNLGTQ